MQVWDSPFTCQTIQLPSYTAHSLRLRWFATQADVSELSVSVMMVVCSAGLGNVVRALLKHRLSSPAASASAADLPIVSNWLTFDAKDHVNGFSQPLLHMFNKDGAFVRSQLGEARWNALASGRSVCLLLGDGLGDASMADGLGLPHVVKIGLLNESDPERVAARLPQYEAAFDAVILGDRSFEWLLSLVRPLS